MTHSQNPLWRQDLLDRQGSQPPKAIQKAYAHPGWIPLARDWGGNNIAVDLAPGPAGKWGQIIIFGRDYDCKYVVARSWAAFLAMVADDFGSDKVIVDEETHELKLKEFKTPTVEPGYLDILRWRMDQKYGRRLPKRKGPSSVNAGSARGSPYGSPTEERGRSPNRLPSHGLSAQSPRGAAMGVPSPLSQVSEETTVSRPTPVRPGIDTTSEAVSPTATKIEKLVEAPTPTIGNEDDARAHGLEAALGSSQHVDGSGKMEPAVKGLGVGGLDEMKSVAI